MKTKEKLHKLIFIAITAVFFSILFASNSTVFAAKITGTVVDESGSPIGGIKVEYGGSEYTTDSSGTYTLEDAGNEGKVKYYFENGEKYEQDGSSATTVTYSPKYEKKDTHYNIVIVKPETGYQSEYHEIEQMISGCKVDKKKVFTYKAGDNAFYDESGNTVSNPYKEYEKIYSQKCKNLFIVIRR